jgi:hypothetical protein
MENQKQDQRRTSKGRQPAAKVKRSDADFIDRVSSPEIRGATGATQLQ